ncbi:hypothetical protein EDB19DRAFT_1763646, partial [Suillus lakei]
LPVGNGDHYGCERTHEVSPTWDCLHVLHTDIVAVWNFHDPHFLHSQEFRELIVKMVDTLEVGPTADPTKTIAIGFSMVGTIAGIMAALAGPAAPIVVPITASVVLAVRVRDVYEISYVPLFILERKDIDTSSLAMQCFSASCPTSSA